MRHPLLPFALVLAGCAVPARNNPNDPANTPDVTISISPLDGSPHTDFTIEVTSSRSNVTRTLDLDSDGIFETAMADDTYVGEIPLPAYVFGSSGVGAVTRAVGVHVTTKDDAHNEAYTDVRLHNEAPALDLGPAIITAAWEQRTVRLDRCGEVLGCTAPDPDGPEGLVYSWRQLVGTPVLPGVVLSSSATFTAPLEPQTLVFELTVSDGFATAHQPLSVRVGHPAWLASSSPPRLFRFHPDAQHVELPSVPPILAASTAANGDVWMVSGTYSSDNWEAVRVSPAGKVLGRWPLSGGVTNGGAGPVVGVGDGGWAQVGVYQNMSNVQELRRLEPITLGTAGTVAVVDPGFEPARLVPDPAVAGGVVVFGNAQAVHVGPDGVPGTPFPSSGADRVCAANDGSIWTAVPSFDPDTGEPIARLHHLLSDDTEETLTLDGTLAGLVPGSEGVLVTLSDGGVLDRIVSVVGTDASAQPAPAVNMQNVTVAGNGDGDVWILQHDEGTIRRLHPRAGRFELAVTAPLEDLGIAPVGGSQPYPLAAADPWIGGLLVTGGFAAGEAMFARVAASGSPFEQALSPIANLVATDATRGAYWTEVYTEGESRMRRIDTRGEILAEIGFSADEFANSTFFGTPDGGVWVSARTDSLTSGRIHRFASDGSEIGTPLDFPGENVLALGLDDTGSLTCIGTNTDNSTVVHLRRADGVEFATGPSFGELPGIAANRSGACWGWLPDGTITFADDTGSQAVAFATGADVIAADPYDDTAWVYDADLGRIHHLEPDGTELDAFDTPAFLGPSSVFPRLAVTRACSPAEEAGNPDCRELWATDGANPGTVYRMDGFGNVTSSFTLSTGNASFLDVR